MGGSIIIFDFKPLFTLGMPAGGDTFFAIAQKKYPNDDVCQGWE